MDVLHLGFELRLGFGFGLTEGRFRTKESVWWSKAGSMVLLREVEDELEDRGEWCLAISRIMPSLEDLHQAILLRDLRKVSRSSMTESPQETLAKPSGSPPLRLLANQYR